MKTILSNIQLNDYKTIEFKEYKKHVTLKNNFFTIVSKQFKNQKFIMFTNYVYVFEYAHKISLSKKK